MVDDGRARGYADAHGEVRAIAIELRVLLDDGLEVLDVVVLDAEVLLDLDRGGFHLRFIGEVGHREAGGTDERLDDPRLGATPKTATHATPTADVVEERREGGTLDGHLAAFGADHHAICPAVDEVAVELLVVLQVLDALALLDPVERRLRDEQVALVDDLRHLPIEERQQERADVRTVHVGVRHDDDVVVAQLLDVEVVAPRHAAPERGDQRADLGAREHLLEARALHVEDLAA